MWKLVYKFLCIFIVAGTAHCYINNRNTSKLLQNSKTNFLNYQLSRIRQHRLSSSTSTNSEKSSYHNTNHRVITPLPIQHHKLRHTNTRFPNLDNILTRIESDDLPTRRTPILRWTTPNPKRTTTTTRTTTAKADEDYEPFDDESDTDFTKKSPELTDWDEDDDEDEYEDEDDDEDDAGKDADWQAEEATEEPTERTLTEYKWRHYGTRARVEESRRNPEHLNNNNRKKEISEAVEHYRKIDLEGSCKIPRAKIINIQHAYPDASKAYLPHCTILHRCADDTGCCKLESQTCAPKQTTRIELYFYTNVMDRSQPSGVEKLAFYNHTECHCIERTQEQMSRDAADLQQHQTTTDNTIKYPFRPGLKTVPEPVASAPEPIRRCRCPELYTPNLDHQQCRCDCENGNRDCMRIKRGKEFFSLKDRLCVKSGECGFPSCEFGVYIRASGRCPRKQEKIEAFSRTTLNK